MNLLILSPGRRVEIVNYFKEEIHKNNGKVFTLDMSSYAPALHFGDKHFIIKKDFNNLEKYIQDIINLCKEHEINYVISLIDPELELLSANKEKFLDNNIIPIVSDIDAISSTFDKFEFYEKYKNQLNLVSTYLGYEEAKKALEEGREKFPLFTKIRNGSGSEGIGKINNTMELEFYKGKENYIFQPFAKSKEFGVDVFFDMISGKIVSMFIKEKLSMRSGETDKAVSVIRQDIIEEVKKLEQLKGFKGPIDVDVFQDNSGKLYINEINPRFGGGYPHAYNCGVNFIHNIVNNIRGIENKVQELNYKENIVMMKYNGLLFKDNEELNS